MNEWWKVHLQQIPFTDLVKLFPAENEPDY
jgi:hypothetical protein